MAIFKSVGAALELLPERVDTWLARHVAEAIGHVTSAPRGHLRENLRHALSVPGASLDDALLERFVDRAFASYGTYWAESAKLPALNEHERASRFIISEGLEYLTDAQAQGRGIIVALPHVGSWEWGGSFLAHLGMPMTAVAEALEPPELFVWFREKRESIGLAIEPLDDNAGKVLLSTLRAGGVVGLLCDRDLQNNGVSVDFFGESVTMPAGPATLALRTGALLVAAACYSGPFDGHHAVITPPIDVERHGKLREDVQRVTQLVARELEWLIRRAPEQWHVLERRFGASTP